MKASGLGAAAAFVGILVGLSVGAATWFGVLFWLEVDVARLLRAMRLGTVHWFNQIVDVLIASTLAFVTASFCGGFASLRFYRDRES